MDLLQLGRQTEQLRLRMIELHEQVNALPDPQQEPLRQTLSALDTIAANLQEAVVTAHDDEPQRELESCYQQITELVSDYAFVSRLAEDGTGTIIWESGDVRKLFGRNMGNLINGSWQQCIHPEDREIASEHLRIISGGTPYVSDMRLLLADGEIRYLRIYAHPQWDAARSRIILYMGAVQDITRYRAAAEALREREEKSRQNEQTASQRNRELASINAIIAAASTTLKLSEGVDTLTRVLREQLNLPGGALYRYDESHELLTMEASWGLSEPTVFAFQTLSVLPFGEKGRLSETTADLAFDMVEIEQIVPKVLNYDHPEWKRCLSVPLTAKHKLQGILYLFGATSTSFDADQVAFFNTIGSQVGIAFHNAHLYEELKISRAELQKLSWRLVEAQETERRHIARELHDEIGQYLTGLKFVLEAIVRLPPETAAMSLDEALSILNNLIERVRNLSLDLRPIILDNLGLLPALIWHIERFTAQSQVQISFSHSAINERFSPEIETAAFRIVQEALTNVARHAEVHAASVRLWHRRQSLLIEVEDRGVGFYPSTSPVSSGLTGMRERAVLLGGRLTVESTPGVGTLLSAELPLMLEPIRLPS